MQYIDIGLPGPEIKGEPFWTVMRWGKNGLYPGVVEQEGVPCICITEKDAEILRDYLNKYNNNAITKSVVRGVDKQNFRRITKNKQQKFKVLRAITSTQLLVMNTNADELRYYERYGKFYTKENQSILKNTLKAHRDLLENPEILLEDEHLGLIVDDIFDDVKNKVKYNELVYTKLKDIFDKYRDTLIHNLVHAEKEFREELEGSGRDSQIYTSEISFHNKILKIHWSIDRIRSIIQEHEISPIQVNVKDYIQYVDGTNIAQKYKGEYQTTPIVVLRIEDDSYIVVDGNHRLNNSFTRGEESILAYILDPREHINAIITEFGKILYKVYINTFKIEQLIDENDEINEEELYCINLE